jgi:hypothetical protein
MISFVETKLFTRLVQEYLSDDEYSRLQQALLSDPEAGAVIPGSGGVRKLRWALPVVASEAASESSIFFALGRVRFGCSRFMQRTWPRTFRSKY